MAWLLPVLTLLAGIGIGFVIARAVPGAAPSRTQRQLDEMQERFEAYQSEVVTHFNTTANLVRKLTKSYQDVQEHLSEGANRLALDEMTRQRLLASLHEDDRYSNSKERLRAPTGTEAPKDYAPKGDDVTGALSDDFGTIKH
jgi:uncharacterized protein